MGRVTKEMDMKESLLDEDDGDDEKTILTADMREMMEQMSDSDSNDDDEDFGADNAPRSPPAELLYNRQELMHRVPPHKRRCYKSDA